MDRKLDFSSILNQIFAIYTANAGVLLPVAFWLFLVVAIVNGLAGTSLAWFPIVVFVTTAIGTLYQGIVVGLVRDVQDGRRDTAAMDLVRAVVPVLVPLVVAGILAGFAIGIGFVLLIAPGLYLAAIWAVIAPAIVIERTGAIAAFGRSRELVRGNGWTVLGVVLVAGLVSAAAGLVFGGIGAAIASGPIVRIVFSALASTIAAPIPALAAGVLYYRLLPPPAPSVPQ